MSETVATVKIENPDSHTGYVIINESDFDPKTMKKYEGPDDADDAKKDEESAAPAPTSKGSASAKAAPPAASNRHR